LYIKIKITTTITTTTTLIAVLMCHKVTWWRYYQDNGLAISRSWDRIVAGHHCLVALCKLLTPMRLWHQAVEFGKTLFYFNQQFISPPPLLS